MQKNKGGGQRVREILRQTERQGGRGRQIMKIISKYVALITMDGKDHPQMPQMKLITPPIAERGLGYCHRQNGKDCSQAWRTKSRGRGEERAPHTSTQSPGDTTAGTKN